MYTNEQITANIETWCQALESGEHKQGQGSLHYTDNGVDHFCCIGVGAKALGVIEGPKATSGPRIEHSYGDSEEYLIAPREFRDMVGLKSIDGRYYDADPVGQDFLTFSLTVANDSDGWNFKQIADLIRSRPKGMFKEGV